MKDTFRRCSSALLLGLLATGCTATNPHPPGSLALIEHQQREALTLACTRDAFEKNLHMVFQASALVSGCRAWAGARIDAPRQVLIQVSTANGFEPNRAR